MNQARSPESITTAWVAATAAVVLMLCMFARSDSMTLVMVAGGALATVILSWHATRLPAINKETGVKSSTPKPHASVDAARFRELYLFNLVAESKNLPRGVIGDIRRLLIARKIARLRQSLGLSGQTTPEAHEPARPAYRV